ncbi:hypothetical protein EIP91_003046 [Steccherinum ochraceum]|uniref:Uncharacterized protein n=1 Tax=Steccherinum ochraceum TaxID=92696 RepID=A0A4R0REK1_9APHY|nr:hypothetical protein EIP91_003046 [Steccherinum ochraceum]
MTTSPSTHVYSSAEWKRQPTTTEVIFGLELPYRAPTSVIGVFFWKWRMWFESTFALSMLQPWEKVLISPYHPTSSPQPVFWLTPPSLDMTVFITTSILILLLTGIFFYFPSHILQISKRATYYLLGSESADLGFSRLGWNDAVTGVVNS